MVQSGEGGDMLFVACSLNQYTELFLIRILTVTYDDNVAMMRTW